MRYHLYTFFIILFICFGGSAYAAEPESEGAASSLPADSLGNAKRQEKSTDEKDKKESTSQTEDNIKKVPKARNKAVPKAGGSTTTKVKAPRINPVKVKVSTQVKIKL